MVYSDFTLKKVVKVKDFHLTIIEEKGIFSLIKDVTISFFNEREATAISKIYGAVTSGNIWQFVKLLEDTLYINLQDYLIDDAKKILGILVAMVK
jgi:hypothetical protein